MLAFRTFLAVDIAALVLALYFFVVGIADGSVSSFNILLWLGVLGGISAIIAVGYTLKTNERRGPANAVLAVLALPAIAAALFVVTLLIAQPRWN
ncbi:hypothetical protein [Hyphomicrobium facile]|uniref:Uncharacterized protein n=1 Tax=Hyphomicrobium facile TaxID=51670 RepID=A0A1I7N017_9HYPH|nr:hypothetical protein [Hyphomicrobium facile]SFV28009.1 hypothetical protein SAMN04488557_0904 [Hyphomicrobium facile]